MYVQRVSTAVRMLTAISLLLAAAAFASTFEERDGITMEGDVVFGNADGIDLKLDIAYANGSDSLVPAIVHIHGGAWRNGRKSRDRALVVRQGRVCGCEYQLPPLRAG